jgi:cation diffusion facilitator CzcD-associated flavoprotein CzcO
MPPSPLLVIGAGPYGLAAAAYAQKRGVDCQLVGRPVEFWYRHMPEAMLLRSGADWHIDPAEVRTFAVYLKKERHPLEHPIPVQQFRGYAGWFQNEYGLTANPALARALRRRNGIFEVELEDGQCLRAHRVLLALGFAHFVHVPTELTAQIPVGRWSHTCDTVRFDFARGRRCLIVGGRQSAYEWAALIREAGATEVHVSHRHPLPRFAPADWSWASETVRAIGENPGWWRNQPPAAQEEIRQKFWAEGRLKLEPWLWPRLDHDDVHPWPNTRLASCTELPGGSLRVVLDTGATFEVDHVIMATGYRVNLQNVPFLAQGGLLDELAMADGSPTLDAHFQSSIPGLYFSGLPATRDFGPFFGFTVGCPAAGKVIVEHVQATACW